MYKGNHVGTIVDGPLCKFRCFAASNEAIYADAREVRNRNFEKLSGIHVDKQFTDKATRDQYKINAHPELEVDQFDAELKQKGALGDVIGDVTHTIHDETHILETIIRTIEVYKNRIMKLNAPKHNGKGVVRVHVSGDFYSQEYFDAWMKAADNFPDIQFYAYTKSIPYWQHSLDIIPSNFMLNASYGGKHDEMIKDLRLKFAKVCFSAEEANNYPYEKDGLTLQTFGPDREEVQTEYLEASGAVVQIKGLPICEEDDAPAYNSEVPFALLLHGVQPKGSPAATAIAGIKNSIKNETLAKRVSHFIAQGDSALIARIKVPVYLAAYSNIKESTKDKEPQVLKKSKDRRLVKTKNIIAVILFKGANKLGEDDKVATSKAKEFKPQAEEYFNELYPVAEKYYKTKLGLEIDDAD
jgi:hypothetical protein